MSGSLEVQERQGPHLNILISSAAFLQLVSVLVFLNSCLNDQTECYLKGATSVCVLTTKSVEKSFLCLLSSSCG